MDTITSKPTPTANPPPGDAQPDLPEMPTWIVHAMAGICAFVLVLAVVLLLAQFPKSPVSSCLKDFMCGLRTQQYHTISQDDHEFDDFASDDEADARSSALESVRDAHDRFVKAKWSAKSKAVKRKAPNLSINTRVLYKGLGIAVAGGRGEVDLECGGQGEDREHHEHQKTSTMTRGWFTAPLPSVPTFLYSPRKPNHSRHNSHDIETGTYHDAMRFGRLASPASIDRGLPLHAATSKSDGYAPRSGFLDHVNSKIHSAADKLARALHDEVKAPEEGLLLPVRDVEREGGLIPGQYVQ